MKRLHTGLLVATLFLGSFVFQNCQPKDGEVGPTGPAGPAGPTGPAGPQGAKGETGTANVQYSPWIPTTFSGSGSTYTGNITAAAITQAVLDRADIRVYWSESGRVLALPYAQTIGGTSYSVHQRFYVGRIELVASYALSSQQFRYVIIPGGAAVGGRKAAIDLNDYEAVKKAYNIPD
ncbi:collagen-like protein [Spirosoma sordidisoli]|uniref:collagen-like protein n=1 Tax=Spirosoma sordidisoli TaxID=2502893 RepID=UPI0013EBB1D9|nr:collagen-like protein [Spirosoma sordidisoli]